MMFYGILAVVALIVMVVVVYPLLRVGKEEVSGAEGANAELLKTQLAELEQDLKQGVIDQAQYDAAKLDLQRTFLDNATQAEQVYQSKAQVGFAVLLAVLIPTMAYFIYTQVGMDYHKIQYMADTVKAPSQQQGAANQGQQAPHATSKDGQVDVNAMVERVRKRAMENPDDLDSWRMLARSLHITKDLDGAAKAYAHLINKGVKEAEIYSRYADVLAMQAGGILVGSPAYMWTLKALEINPNDQQSLWIAGTAAYYSRDYDLAKKYWTHLLSLLEPGTETYQSIQQNLVEIESMR